MYNKQILWDLTTLLQRMLAPKKKPLTDYSNLHNWDNSVTFFSSQAELCSLVLFPLLFYEYTVIRVIFNSTFSGLGEIIRRDNIPIAIL